MSEAFLGPFKGLILSIFFTAVGPLSALANPGGVSASFLPPDALIIQSIPGNQLGGDIGAITLKILMTPTGKNYCRALSAYPAEFKRGFFNAGENLLAETAMELCKGSLSNETKHPPYQKRYFLVLTDSKDFPADGWTTPLNETYIVMNRSEYSHENLIRILIHEIVVSLDKKGQIGILSEDDLFTYFEIVPNSDSCAANDILRFARLRHSLTTLRALEVEAQIASEMGLTPSPLYAHITGMSCREKLEFIWPYVDKIIGDAPNPYFHSDKHACGKTKVPSVPTPLQLFSLATKLKYNFLNGESKTVCEYLTEGLPIHPGVNFRGGPKPRVGGGGWNRSSGGRRGGDGG